MVYSAINGVGAFDGFNVFGSKDRTDYNEHQYDTVFGISGITDVNFREGYDPATGVFDKSKTHMMFSDELKYVRMANEDLVDIAFTRGEALGYGKDGRLTVLSTGEEVNKEHFDAVTCAMAYPLQHVQHGEKNGFYLDEQAKENGMQPYLMLFEIGSHRVEGENYTSDRVLPDFYSNDRAKYKVGDHFIGDDCAFQLEPGKINVKQVVKINKIEAPKDRPDLQYIIELEDVTPR